MSTFAVVYQFTVKEGQETAFEHNWAIVTESIKRVRGGLGSVLHKTENALVYIAYAQWPSKEIFDKHFDENMFSTEEQAARAAMRATTEKIETLHSLNIIKDLLVR